MTNIKSKHHIDGLLALLLFSVFAVCILSVLLTGADAYRGLTRRDRASYEQRTCMQYLATKVRQAPSVSVGEFGGTQALLLWEEIDGARYLTRIYCFDGWVRELFSSDEDGFLPEDGEKVIQARRMSLALEDGLLSLSVTDDGGRKSALLLSLRVGEGAAP